VLAAGAQSRASINLILAPYRTLPRNAGTSRQLEFADIRGTRARETHDSSRRDVHEISGSETKLVIIRA
jgi:hypothetical protein